MELPINNRCNSIIELISIKVKRKTIAWKRMNKIFKVITLNSNLISNRWLLSTYTVSRCDSPMETYQVQTNFLMQTMQTSIWIIGSIELVRANHANFNLDQTSRREQVLLFFPMGRRSLGGTFFHCKRKVCTWLNTLCTYEEYWN